MKHLQMELVRYDRVPSRNEVMPSEETLRDNADAMSVFFYWVFSWPHLR